MRQGRADLVYIVISEGVMALYAANNIAKAMKRFATNGIGLGGLILIDRAATNYDGMRQFARRIGTRIVAEIPDIPDCPRRCRPSNCHGDPIRRRRNLRWAC